MTSGADETGDKSEKLDDVRDGESRKRAKEALRREKEAEKKRLAGALRANLMRRKVQSRARREGEADERDEGLPGAGPSDSGDQ
ncbi:MAG TPA: hypothetical protein VE079_12120 [Ensifer sp.]|nr:hypothetical protein [Ensifer sp.]